MKKILSTVLLVMFASSYAFSQEVKEDESKMIREVITLQVDKAAFAPKAAPAPPAKKGKNQPPQSEPAPDTTGITTMPAPASEIQKRMQNYTQVKPVGKYTKSNCAANGATTTCNASFEYKSKELNPTEKIDGKIIMTITLEAKEGKYRYTINNIKHVADDGVTNGGDVYNLVPECGSTKISALTWKRIKGAALADAKIVADDLKTFMSKLSSETDVKKDEW
jgi:hypothetical protein